MGIRTAIFKLITGIDYSTIQTHKKFFDAALKNLEKANKSGSDNDGLNENYLFDFKSYSASVNNNFLAMEMPQFDDAGGVTPMNPEPVGVFMDGAESREGSKPKPNQKIKIKPIDVLNQLETIPTPFTLALIDEKIAILEDKAKLISQVYAKRELLGLKERLVNRKKYMNHKAFFEQFTNTTQEKIDLLLSKYELVMKSADIFIPEFPDEAVIRMKAYSEKSKEICGKQPVYYVIAEEKDFKKAYEKRDPILLVQSPFGFYWQILGAWDKEMLILSELCPKKRKILSTILIGSSALITVIQSAVLDNI